MAVVFVVKSARVPTWLIIDKEVVCRKVEADICGTNQLDGHAEHSYGTKSEHVLQDSAGGSFAPVG